MITARRNHPVTGHASVVDADTQFIDVREPDEVLNGTISGTTNIPLGQLAERVTELDPSRRTVVLCRSGGRSTQAADFLVRCGFTDVINLDGGMLAYEARSQGGQRS